MEQLGYFESKGSESMLVTFQNETASSSGTGSLRANTVANPKGIARDVFVPVGKFTFPANFVIVDYKSDPRVPLILGRPFLRTARALIDVHGEEMILHDGNERLILNMRNNTSSYSHEPHQESINMIDIYNVSHEEIREDLFATNHPSGNPTSSLTSHTNLTSSKVINPESGNPTLTSEISDYSLEEFVDELALIESFPPGNDDMTLEDVIIDLLLEEFTDELALIDLFLPGNDNMTPEDVIKQKECLLNQSPLANYSHNDNLDDTISEMFTDEHALDYSSPPLWDDYDDNLFDVGELMWINVRSLPFPECDSVFYEDFFEVDTLSSTNNDDKVFNLEVPGLGALLSFSSENEEKVYNPGILTSKRVHYSLSPELLFIGVLKHSKSLKFLKARWRFFLALTKRTSESWMFRVSTSIPLEKLKYGGLGQAK
ncbi:reverse transcriptase domain-containing protein [Tanacetum coccineum]|uniref:Reverse transcriptase domain-containing protein n=1 Tax=Tanacetum coccineum TaxID=301880 RepID=A0ABQ5EFQ9_9ASTR